MAVSKNNKACRRDGSSYFYTKGELRDQGRPKQEEEPTKNKTRQDPSRQDPNCAPRQRFFRVNKGRGRRKMRRSLLDGTGEGGGMPCGWPSGIAPPFSSLLLHMS
ncbi:hypothetical protein SEVIR_1G274500v4 [Setaria viridis]|uniref:Uncharacterized protein n=1 Tax=Setaria viridis TaxID=4556 RepID=A0A4U6WF97_SETVI|nr:hypothetical protein SEVIR_1G274500v2 [Setaria viridis]